MAAGIPGLRLPETLKENNRAMTMEGENDQEKTEIVQISNDEKESKRKKSKKPKKERKTDGETDQEEYTTSIETKKKKKKALMELRCRVEDAIIGNYLLGKPNKALPRHEAAMVREQLKEITLWGVPLLPSKGHEGTDILLLKFLKARDFKVHEAFEMLRKTLKWRRDFKTDEIVEENMSVDLQKMVQLNSSDKEGHPLCYNVYEAFRDKEMYDKILGTEEKCIEYLRCRIKLIEEGIKKLSFKNGGVTSIVQISDLKSSPGPAMKELRSVSQKALSLLEDNYPELIHKMQIIINVPLWYYFCHKLRSRLINQKANGKFVFARPSEVTKTLIKFVAPEELPVQYGGLRRDEDEDFSTEDKASELIIKKNTTACIEFPVSEAGVTIVWDVTVVGWDVLYKEEFMPKDEGSYRILLQNQQRVGESVRNSFYISEPGTIVITVDNGTFKKKRAFYRSKAKPTVPVYVFLKKVGKNTRVFVCVVFLLNLSLITLL